MVPGGEYVNIKLKLTVTEDLYRFKLHLLSREKANKPHSLKTSISTASGALPDFLTSRLNFTLVFGRTSVKESLE